ncbi:pentapeptide repeat-containing protein [Streptomyces albus]|uniref:pentapeptide repeat-containing protein n=1 Tax=Streptomyces albus TaxID=1888 RepID=UPI0036FBEF7A
MVLHRSVLRRVAFRGAAFGGADFVRAVSRGADFVRAAFRSAAFPGVALRGAVSRRAARLRRRSRSPPGSAASRASRALTAGHPASP